MKTGHRGSEAAHYRELGWSQIFSLRWDGKENTVRPGPTKVGWKKRQRFRVRDGARPGADPPRYPGEEELSTAGLL